jgi:serine/threonine protein phosphatase PrpC
MIIYITSQQGKRKENEDNHNCVLNIKGDNPELAKINFYQVCDGHNGEFVSLYLKKKLSPIFMNKSLKLDDKTINKIFNGVNKQLKDKHLKDSFETGSTCLVVLQYNDKLKIINTGDSRAIICNKNNIAIPLSLDHKVMTPDEIRRLGKLNADKDIEFDGHDWRLKDLSLSRVFGDFDNQYVTCDPDIFDYKLDNDRFLILGCDGLYDNLSNQEIVDYVLTHYYTDDYKFNNTNDNIAEKLALHAINDKHSQDNVSVILVFL